MRLVLRSAAAASLILAVMAAGGCQKSAVLSGAQPLPKQENSAAFLDRVSSSTSVSENDAMRGMLLLLEGKDDAKDFAQRGQKLKSRGIVADSWQCQADQPVTRGRLAYMVYQAMQMRGGVWLTLLGPTQRYCLRELQFRGVMVSGTALTPVSGMEFGEVLRKADGYIRTKDVPTTVGTTSEDT